MEVTHPDRVLFPGEGITKGDVVDYYRRVAPVMVPHVRNRPLMLERYREVWSGKPVADDEASPLVSVLKLSGVVRPGSDGTLQVGNRILNTATINLDGLFPAPAWYNFNIGVNPHTLVSSNV